MKLEIIDLHVEVDEVEVLKGITLTFEQGKVHALLGPNGSGKSSLAHTIMGNPKYVVTKGTILLGGKDITNLKVDERARLGLFLSFQYPAEIAGVTISKFLRAACNAQRSKKLSVVEFHTLLKQRMADLKMDSSFSKRYLNEGFSGGEKKRCEILQLMMLEPIFAMLDETDSGLDVDAMKIVAEGINAARKKKDMGIILITHYNKFIRYIEPDMVSVISNGKIVKQGGKGLAHQIEEKGFEGLLNDN